LAVLCGFLPLTYPAASAWQPQISTWTTAFDAGQTLTTELNDAFRIELPVSFPLGPSNASLPSVNLTILSAPGSFYETLPVQVDLEQGKMKVALARIHLPAGTQVRLDFEDPDAGALIGSTEFDSYAGGERSLAGRPVGGDLSFRVFYRRSLAASVLAGLDGVRDSWGLVLAAISVTFAAGFFASGCVQRQLDLDLAGWVSFGIGSGLLVTAVIAFVAVLLRLRLTAALIVPTTLMLVLGGWILWWHGERKPPVVDSTFLIFGLWVVLIAAQRLAFAAGQLLPPHEDSIANYSIVLDMLHPDRPFTSTSWPRQLLSNYYHFGFHAWASWILGLAGTSSPKAYLVLGQLIQAAAVAAVYFLCRLLARRSLPALLATMLAGVGWIMPAYASNWAKLPALAGLAGMPAAIGLAWIALRGGKGARGQRFVAAGFAIGAVTLVHTRMLFLLVAFIAAFAAADWVFKPAGSRRRRRLAPVIAMLLALAALLVLRSPREALEGVWFSIVKFTENQGLVTTIIVTLTAPFALRRYRVEAAACLLWSGALFLAQLVPPGAEYPFPLLDPPIASMALYLPLSCLAGLSLSSLYGSLRARSHPARRVTTLVVLSIAAGVCWLGWMLSRQELSYAPCCQIASNDDAAIAELGAELISPQARVLISGDSPPGYTLVPVDGGAWLYPISQIKTVTIPTDFDFALPESHDLLCDNGITHIYVGMRPSSFRRETLGFAPSYYSPVIALRRAALYSVDGCEPG